MKTRMTAAVIGLAFAVSSCGGGPSDLELLATRTCGELEGAIVLQVGSILSGAIAEAEAIGASGPELGDEMRLQCAGLLDAVDQIGTDREERDALPSQVAISGVQCGSDRVTGRVRNGSDKTLDIGIDVFLNSSSGVRVGDSFASVRALPAGQTAQWDAFVGSQTFDRCEAVVSSARES